MGSPIARVSGDGLAILGGGLVELVRAAEGVGKVEPGGGFPGRVAGQRGFERWNSGGYIGLVAHLCCGQIEIELGRGRRCIVRDDFAAIRREVVRIQFGGDRG